MDKKLVDTIYAMNAYLEGKLILEEGKDYFVVSSNISYMTDDTPVIFEDSDIEYDNSDGGNTQYFVLSLEGVYVKFSGEYSSWDNMPFDTAELVKPVEKTITVWETTK